MKTSTGIVLWAIVSLLNISSLFAQVSLLETTIELNHKTGTVKSFLTEITDETGITFSYLNNQMPLDKTIVLENQQTSLKDLLDRIAQESGLTYVVKNKKVFFVRNENTNKHTISGTIRDKASGETLIGATVYIPELKAGIISNTYGFYSLTIPSGDYTIESSYLGYEPFRETLLLKTDIKPRK